MGEVNKRSILVVEDDADVRDEVSDLLRERGYSVIQAVNGQEALAQLRSNHDVRAIILDVTMPVMNGATFRGEQLADPSIAGIPLILLTGRVDAAPLANMLGSIACLQKPFTPEALFGALDRVERA